MKRGQAIFRMPGGMRYLDSILGRINFILLSFFLLITVSVGATYWGLQAQAEDALVINLAGRQRMLVQQMTRLALEPGGRGDNSGALSFAMATFDETLGALRDGGEVRYPTAETVWIPPAREAGTRRQLDQVRATWERYRADLERTLAHPSGSSGHTSAVAEVQKLAPVLSDETDAAVRLFQADSKRRIGILRWLQTAFFLSAAALLGAGRLSIQRTILTPLKHLRRAAERIRSGDLHTPVGVSGPSEIRLLAGDFETMRTELEDSRGELLDWGQELEERVRQRTRELDALYEVSREISSRLESRQVLQSITTKARGLLQAEASFICLLDAEHQNLSLQAISGPEETVRRTSTPAQNPFVQGILEERGPGSLGKMTCRGTCGIMTDSYRASHQAAPLCRENRVIGALCVGHRRKNAFSEEQSSLLARMANAAAVALENARLYEQAERISALEERQRIAADMHDGLAQVVDSLGLLVDQASDLLEMGSIELAERTLKGARARVSQASVEVRRSIASLQDERSQTQTVQEHLKTLIQQVAAEAGPVQWDVALEGALLLPDGDAQQVLGIAQEALANARQHSGASRISLRLEHIGEEACLIIEDNGCGFDPSVQPPTDRRHFGLKILQARASQLEGRLAVHSAPGQGTCISLTWPVRRLSVPLGMN